MCLVSLLTVPSRAGLISVWIFVGRGVQGRAPASQGCCALSPRPQSASVRLLGTTWSRGDSASSREGCIAAPGCGARPPPVLHGAPLSGAGSASPCWAWQVHSRQPTSPIPPTLPHEDVCVPGKSPRSFSRIVLRSVCYLCPQELYILFPQIVSVFKLHFRIFLWPAHTAALR